MCVCLCLCCYYHHYYHRCHLSQYESGLVAVSFSRGLVLGRPGSNGWLCASHSAVARTSRAASSVRCLHQGFQVNDRNEYLPMSIYIHMYVCAFVVSMCVWRVCASCVSNGKGGLQGRRRAVSRAAIRCVKVTRGAVEDAWLDACCE